MPTYEYECRACAHAFERFQNITEKPVRVCPVCGKRRVRRIIGAGAAVIFKGSGFYQTDYRSKSYKRRSSEEKTAPTDSKATSDKAKGEDKQSEAPE